MANMLTYLSETMGDSLEQLPFGPVDNLILSQFAYTPLEEVCTAEFDFTKGISLGEAAAAMLATPNIKDKILLRRDLSLMKLLTESERFRNLRLCGCQRRHETAEPEQFAAYCVELSTNPTCWFAAFRGTDRTLTGWEEDFQLSYLDTIPAQEDAVRYLEQAAAALPGQIMLGGHSKGGNAAVYAAVFCSVSVQRRIVKTYNNDGPGFQPNVMTSPRYEAIASRIITIVPQDSFVGQLLAHPEPCMVVRSNTIGILQHMTYSWEVKDGVFETVPELSESSQLASHIMQQWLAGLTSQQRETLTKQLFAIPERAGVDDTLTLRAVQKVIPRLTSQLKSLTFAERELIQSALTDLSRIARRVLRQEYGRKSS